MVRCSVCTLIYQNPRPTPAALPLIYPAAYDLHQPVALTHATLHEDYHQIVRLLIAQQGHTGSLLDIGCGSGAFLQALRLLAPGWGSAGIEASQQAALLARQQGFAVEHATIEQAQLGEQNWNAVTLWNVLEHLPDPVGVLQRIKRCLHANGYLYLAVPLYGSWDCRIFGRYWFGWELPRHFFIPDRHTLQQLLNAGGFQLVTTAGTTGSVYAWNESLRQFIKQVSSYALQRILTKLTYTRYYQALIKPYIRVASIAKQTTVLLVAARIAAEDPST